MLLRAIIILTGFLYLSSVTTSSSRTGNDGNELWASPLRSKYQPLHQKLFRREVSTEEDSRLPGDIVPIQYQIQLIPFIDDGKNSNASGHIDIEVECVNSTNTITMNSAGLLIDESSVTVTDMENEIILRILGFTDEQDTKETITIELSPPQLQPGKRYKIKMSFTTVIGDNLRGFYRSSYEENGATKYLVMTQMEPTHARRVFPCFDEPNMKANFSIALGRKKSMVAASNMPFVSGLLMPEIPDYVLDAYETSDLMSSYSVGLIVGDLVKIPSSESPGGVAFSIFARSSFINQTKYARSIGPMILSVISNKLLAINFPLPKLDIAAVPDLAAGAMENWGLITTRESNLLYDEQKSSKATKERVAFTIAHAIGLQWLGNLVTMDWWDSVWLKEGFATYMAGTAITNVAPEIRVENDHIIRMHHILAIDALEYSRPLNYEVSSPREIGQIFDDISSLKGSALLRMCANMMGQFAFNKGVVRYIKQNSYGNVNQDDLWKALQVEVDGENPSFPFNIKTVMDGWTDKKGYPVVRVTRDYNRGSAVVTQEKFVLRKNQISPHDTTTYRWWIPLTFTTDFKDIKTDWLTSNTVSNTITTLWANETQWVIFNVNQLGYYRVLYDNQNYELIYQQLMKDHQQISVASRAQLLDDYLNFARSNLTLYFRALSITRYLKKERDYLPWTAASNVLGYLDRMLYGFEHYSFWKNYLTSLITGLYEYVTFTEETGDSYPLILTRTQAVEWACRVLSITDCVEKARTAFEKWIADPADERNVIPPNLRRTIMCTAVATGSFDDWNNTYNNFLNSNLPDVKADLLSALACARTPLQLKQLLEYTISSDSGIRPQDAVSVFSDVAASPTGNDVALMFLIARWDDIVDYFGTYDVIPQMFRSLCNRINDEGKFETLVTLYEEHTDVLGSSLEVLQGLEIAQSNCEWIKNYYEAVAYWLQNEVPPTVITSTSTSVQSTTTVPVLSTTTPTMPAEDGRLPGDIIPHHYGIQLIPFFDDGKKSNASGFVEIEVECVSSTNTITMNSADLLIDESSIRVIELETETTLRILRFVDDQESKETITIQLSPPQLQPGKRYRIKMSFTTIIGDNLRGFYRSYYEEDGATKYLAVTHMEPTHARRVFPCFDEPNMKANFSIALGRKRSMLAASNMPFVSGLLMPEIPGYVLDAYETSAPMSSYSVGLIVGDMVKIPSSESSGGVAFSIFARSSFINQTKYAGYIGPKILSVFSNNLLTTNFPLPKLDIAAVPDLASGAMENWGLITTREANLLYDDRKSSRTIKERIIKTITREIALQWLGNLVTMNWWDSLWLKEGFATYMEGLAIGNVESEMRIQDDHIVNMHHILAIDALESSRPLNYKASSPTEIGRMFDAISSLKGSALLHMCSDMIGPYSFSRGVARYVKQNAYGNVNQDDLWTALQAEVDEQNPSFPFKIKTVMDGWTDKKGYPVVTVIRDYIRGSAIVTQERYLLRKNQISPHDTTVYRWWIPLTFTTDFKDIKTDWITSNTGSNILPTVWANESQWVIFNAKQTGYYRVLYDNKNYELIYQQLMKDHQQISVASRAQLLDDYLNFARSNMTLYFRALSITRYLIKERDYLPWTAASNVLGYLDRMLYGYEHYSLWTNYMTSLVTKLYEYVTFAEGAGDSYSLILTRTQAIEWACRVLGIRGCVETARTEFTKWLNDPANETNALLPNLRRTIMCTAIATGSPQEWIDTYDYFLDANLPDVKADLLSALSCAKTPFLLKQLLEFTISSDSGIRPQDAVSVFSDVAASPVGNDVALNFLTDRWDDIVDYFGTYDVIPKMFRSICDRINDEDKLQTLIKLREEHIDVLGSSLEVLQGLEIALSNCDWIKNYYEAVVNWLQNEIPPTTVGNSSLAYSTDSPTPSSSIKSSTTSSLVTSTMTTTTTTPTTAGSSTTVSKTSATTTTNVVTSTEFTTLASSEDTTVFSTEIPITETPVPTTASANVCHVNYMTLLITIAIFLSVPARLS